MTKNTLSLTLSLVLLICGCHTVHGYYIYATSLDIACGTERVSAINDGATIIVWSDHNGYGANLTCRHTFTTGYDYVQYVVWLTDIHLPPTTNCSDAKLAFYDGIDNHTQQITGETGLCSLPSNPMFMSQSPVVTVEFTTTKADPNSHGFRTVLTPAYMSSSSSCGSSSAFRCNSGVCIPKMYVCDGVPNCDDLSDENSSYCSMAAWTIAIIVVFCVVGVAVLIALIVACIGGSAYGAGYFCSKWCKCCKRKRQPTIQPEEPPEYSYHVNPAEYINAGMYEAAAAPPPYLEKDPSADVNSHITQSSADGRVVLTNNTAVYDNNAAATSLPTETLDSTATASAATASASAPSSLTTESNNKS